MKTTLSVVGERVSRLLILGALTAPSGGGRRRPALSSLAVFVAIGLVMAPSTAYAACGGAGQRACCLFEANFLNFGACRSGLKEILIPTCGAAVGSCGCAISWCADITSCGGDGDRACCFLERLPPCDDGLIEDLAMGCVTDRGVKACTCESGGTSFGICRNKRGVGENCDPLFDPCEDGLVCRQVALFKSKCFADLDSAVSAEECLSFFDRDVLDNAVSAMPVNGGRGETMFFGFGSAGGFIAQSSNVRGVVYGRDGCYG